ncbi:NTP transferase domain-containing protein [Candidatus Micrarchaeota archaeon]|nr:NTP transferase domain-containing protein [Candidatus Micrarchaeota archaeon]
MGRVRVSLSLDEMLVKEIDRGVDGINITSRSEAIERVLREHVGKDRACVILAGGPPANLFIPRLGRYRPLVDVGGKTLIECIAERVSAAGIDTLIVVGSHEVNSKIFERIGNGEKQGVQIKYVEEEEHKGSAHSLKLAEQFVEGPFLFIPCDHYFDFDLSKLWYFHRERHAPVTLAVYAGADYTWNKTSIVKMEGDSIVQYWEKPSKAETHLTATLIGFANPEIFGMIAIGGGSIESVFERLSRKGKLNGFHVSGKFVNVHSAEDVERVKKLIRS